MKKVIITVLAITMLSGCTAWRNNENMDDYDLCQRLGYDRFHGYNGIMKSDATEIARRINMGIFSMSIDSCRSLAINGYQNEVEFSNRIDNFNAGIAAANQNANQQPSYTTVPVPAPLPQITQCSQFGNQYFSSVHCTTY